MGGENVMTITRKKALTRTSTGSFYGADVVEALDEVAGEEKKVMMIRGTTRAGRRTRPSGTVPRYRSKMVTTTRVKPQFQGPLILSKLSGSAFQAFKHWSKDDDWLESKDGAKRLLQAMDRPEYFGEDKDEEMIASMARLTYHLKRNKDEGHRAFFNRWEEAYRKIQEHGIDLPDRYLGFLMINALGLDENTIKSFLTYTHGSITTKDVKEWTRKFESKLLARQRTTTWTAKTARSFIRDKKKNFTSWRRRSKSYRVREETQWQERRRPRSWLPCWRRRRRRSLNLCA